MKFFRILALLLALCLLPLSAGVFFAAENENAAGLETPILTVEQIPAGFFLTWSAPSSEINDVTGYLYCCYPEGAEKPDESEWKKVDPSTLSAELKPTAPQYEKEYTILLKAVAGAAKSEEATAKATLISEAGMSLAATADRVKSETFSASLKDAPNKDALSEFLKKRVEAMGEGIRAQITVTKFTPGNVARAGSFVFAAVLEVGRETQADHAKITLENLEGKISSANQLPSPEILLTKAEEGGLKYVILPKGTAEEKACVLHYSLSVYSTLTDKAIISSYTVDETEGVLSLSSELKGEFSYYASVKSVTNNAQQYLDSPQSAFSAPAVAGRIPITVKPEITSKIYGEKDPEDFGFTVVSPETIPTSLVPKLRFTRDAGEERGEYQFTCLPDAGDTNFEITVETVAFLITPRPITLRPSDLAVKFEEGLSALPEPTPEVGGNGLCTGHTATLIYDEADAKVSVGEFAVTPIGAIITDENGADVTKNYSITFLSGKLSVKDSVTEAETESSAFPIWLIFVLLAVFLLAVAGVILFFLLRKQKPESPATPEPIPEPTLSEPPLAEVHEPIPEPPVHDHTEGYDEFLGILNLEETERTSPENEETFLPQKTSPDLAKALKEIENAQAKTMEEE